MNMSIYITVAAVTWLALGPYIFLYAVGQVEETGELQCSDICTYRSEYYYADCTNLDLNVIPQQCSGSEYLDFRRNGLQYVDRTSFTGFKNLRYVYLEYNNIRNITPRAFTACRELRELFLQNNPLVVISNDTFWGLTVLTHLYLSYARLDVLDASAFTGLPSLERLFLNDNFLRTLPKSVFHNLQTLEILILSNNELQYLHSEQFQGLSQLKHLDLQNNQISRLGNGLFQGLLSLKALNVSHNSIFEIQNGALDLVNLARLETIDMCYNNIIGVSNFSNHLMGIPNVFFAGNPMHCGCETQLLMKWYERHIHTFSSTTDRRTEVICHGPKELTGIPMKNVSSYIVSCKGHSRLNPVLVSKDQSDQMDSERSSSEFEIGAGSQDITGEGQVQVRPESGKSSITNSDDETNVYMLIGIAGLLLCGAFIMFILAVVYAKYKRLRDNRSRELEIQAKEKQQPPPSTTVSMRITENPLPENNDEDDVYEPIANVQEHQLRRPRGRLTTQKSADSAYSESSFLDSPGSDDFPPPSYSPPQPPSNHISISSLPNSGYVQCFQNHNGKVYLCTQYPCTIPDGNSVLMHSVSLPSHSANLSNFYRPHSKSQPLMPHQNSFPEGFQSHDGTAYTCVDHVTPPQVELVPSCTHPMKYQTSDVCFRSQNQTIAPQHGQMQESPLVPQEVDNSSYSQMHNTNSYPSTNPFASSQMVQNNPNPTQPRRVSFSNVTTIHGPSNTVST